MSHQARCVVFFNGYKIVATTNVADGSTNITTSTYPMDSTTPTSTADTGFSNYPDEAALNAAIAAAISAAEAALQAASEAIATSPPPNLPDPLASASGPAASPSSPIQAAPAQRSDELKSYRQTVGSESPADVARSMMGIIDNVKAGQSSYVSSSGQVYRESLRGAFERQLGLKSVEIPEDQVLPSDQQPFVYFIYALLHNKTIVQSIDGVTGLSGQDLTNKLYESMVARLKELDGHSLLAAMDAADAIRTTGTQILSTIVGAKAGVTPTKQKISSEIAKGVDRASGILNTIENWGSTTFSPTDLTSLFGVQASLGGVDYQLKRFDQDDAGKTFIATPETAGILQGTSLSFAFLNTGADTMRKEKLALLDRTQTFAAKHRYYGDVYSVLVDGKGMEKDPNTLTMRMVVSYFAACLKTVKGVCSECRYYSGPPATSQPATPASPSSPQISAFLKGADGKIYPVTIGPITTRMVGAGETHSQPKSSSGNPVQVSAFLKGADGQKYPVTIGPITTRMVGADSSKTNSQSKLTCAFGFVNANNTNKGPNDYCWTDSIAPNRGIRGVRYQLNAETSQKIRTLAASLSKG